MLDHICADLPSRPHETASFRKQNIYQYWFEKHGGLDISTSKKHTVGFSKWQDIRKDVMESQRKLISTEIDSSCSMKEASWSTMKSNAGKKKKLINTVDKIIEREKLLEAMSPT